MLYWKDHLPLLDVCKEHLLALHAGLSPVPPTVKSTVTRERSIATEEDVHNDPQGPHITLLIVTYLLLIIIIFINHKSIHYFRSHVLQATHRSEEFRSRHLNTDRGAQVKITEFHRPWRVMIHTENIVRLYVSVSNTLLVKMTDGFCKIFDDPASLCFGEKYPLLNML